MDAKDIESRVIDIVREIMGEPEGGIKPETRFIEDLPCDSLDLVEMTMEFEDEFDISIPDEEAENLRTVGQAVEYIANCKSKIGN